MSVKISDSSGIPIAISGVGYVYDEYDIEIGRFLVDSTLRMNAPQYFFLHTHGNIDIWASADHLEDCNPEPDMLECFTNKIKIVMDVVSATNFYWVIGGFGFLEEGSKIGELTFWYSKCEKGIYMIKSNEY
jgi:hypothetical protein